MAEARCYCGSDCTGCGDCRHWGNYSGTCGQNCSGCSGCSGSCGRGCNTGCHATEALTLYDKLVAGLNQVIYAADMANINRMIEIEAGETRKNVSITSVNFATGNTATSAQIKQLQNNLKKIGQTTTKRANVGDSIAAATGNELITKVLASADTTLTT